MTEQVNEIQEEVLAETAAEETEVHNRSLSQGIIIDTAENSMTLVNISQEDATIYLLNLAKSIIGQVESIAEQVVNQKQEEETTPELVKPEISE